MRTVADLSFGELVAFFVKALLAAIPALVMFGAIMFLLGIFLTGVYQGLAG